MTLIRKTFATVGFALALILSLAPAASADPGDPGTTFTSSSATTSGGNGWAYGRKSAPPAFAADPAGLSTTTLADPGDPGTTY